LFYVGALLMKKGVFWYLRMVEVLNLPIFSFESTSGLGKK